MRDYQLLVRRLRPHRGVMLLALVVFAATGYVACSGDDRTFGSGGTGGDDTSVSSDGTGADVEDDTNKDDTEDDTTVDTNKDDSPSTNG